MNRPTASGRALLGLTLLMAAQTAPGDDSCRDQAGTLAAIQFVGNDTTRDKTLLRELPFRPGDAVTGQQAEAGRQAIANLRLFKRVDLTCHADGENGLVLEYRLDEKYYVVPIPRLDANSDGEYAYGLQLRWFNVAGLNQTLKASVERADEQRENRGTGLNYRLGYTIPWLGDSLWGLGMFLSHSREPVERRDIDGQYTEIVDTGVVAATRHVPGRSRSQGLTLGLGLETRVQSTEGPLAIAPFGQATAPVLSGRYEDIVFRGYSETGIEWEWDIAAAGDATGADYDFQRLQSTLVVTRDIGSRAHQNVALTARLGLYAGGPDDGEFQYDLGGSSELNGYPGRTLEADRFVLLGLDYLHPTTLPGTRLLARLETGRGWQRAEGAPGGWLGSFGVGLRVRLTSFVRVEFDLGFAIPLGGATGDHGARFFGSGN